MIVISFYPRHPWQRPFHHFNVKIKVQFSFYCLSKTDTKPLNHLGHDHQECRHKRRILDPERRKDVFVYTFKNPQKKSPEKLVRVRTHQRRLSQRSLALLWLLTQTQQPWNREGFSPFRFPRMAGTSRKVSEKSSRSRSFLQIFELLLLVWQKF